MELFLPRRRVMTVDSPAFVVPSAGKIKRMAVGFVRAVVKMKKVMSRKPRSTMGVRSTRVESFFDFFTPRDLRGVAGVDISAMVEWFWNEMRRVGVSISAGEFS